MKNNIEESTHNKLLSNRIKNLFNRKSEINKEIENLQKSIHYDYNTIDKTFWEDQFYDRTFIKNELQSLISKLNLYNVVSIIQERLNHCSLEYGSFEFDFIYYNGRYITYDIGYGLSEGEIDTQKFNLVSDFEEYYLKCIKIITDSIEDEDLREYYLHILKLESWE